MAKLADFYIPNFPDATYGSQSEPDSRDFDWIAAGFEAQGQRTGGAVTAQNVPNMTVDVALGTGTFNGTDFSWAHNAALTIAAADPSNPRLDLVVVSSAGSISAITGTAASHPVFPDPGASVIVLAAVYVPANATTIATANIIDKRLTISDQFLLANGARPLTANWIQSGAYDIYTAGALRVGSSSAPANTTAGDLTFTRGFIASLLNLTEIATPANPAAGTANLYAKSNGGVSALYYLGDNGVEVGPLGASSSAGTGSWARPMLLMARAA